MVAEEEEETKDEDEDEVGHLVKRMNKLFTKRAKSKRRSIPKKGKKPTKGDSSKNEPVCYECKELGHIRPDGPWLKKAHKGKPKKKKAMMAMWEDLDEEQATENQEE